MKKFLLNDLEPTEFISIITLLDYKTQISICLKSIKLDTNKIGKILIDTLLCSGMNEYRFIKTTLNEDGTINLDNYEYIEVNNDILKKANEIIKNQPIHLKNSILTESEIMKILKS